MRKLAGLALSAALLAPSGAEEPRGTTAQPRGTIAFSSLAPRGWDVYTAAVADPSQVRRITSQAALDYNAAISPDGRQLAFVSERDGNLEIYCAAADGSSPVRLTREFALDDHPRWSPDGSHLAFSSTRKPNTTIGEAWNAVYVMRADGSDVRRVSPEGATDYSPAWSPRGDLLAVASGSGKTGEADIYVMKTDGSDRRLVVKNGGWPTFAGDGESLFFHSRRQNRWGIWRVRLDGSQIEQLSETGVDAFTPHASADGKWLIAAIRRGGQRQIELCDLATGQWKALTKDATDHWNPTISADGATFAFHRAAPDIQAPNVERWDAPQGTELHLIRLAGSFPAFAPDGKRVALMADGFAALDVMNVDGSNRTTLHSGRYRGMFSTSWAHQDEEIAFATGGVFEQPTTDIDLLAIRPDGTGLRKVTEQRGNKGFPAYSPDGKQLVFRSGADGSKNLYIANRDGSGLRQLTSGRWTDTMADWSPRGDWIVFASDRDENFDIWLVRPDGSDLKPLVAGGGRDNHPHFSPDAGWIVFTSMRAGYSAEEASLPSQPQPYGDLFAIRLDGTGLVRLTHNGFEEGTPAWGPLVEIEPSSNARPPDGTGY